MRDQRGLYYHTRPGDTGSRVYVRRGADGEVEFRLWEADHPEIWERHPWLPMQAVREAATCYRESHPDLSSAADPLRLYDLAVARALLEEDDGPPAPGNREQA